MKRFEIEFAERTKEILEDYEGKYELSNLLNCTLGLVVLPYERLNDNQQAFWDTELDEVPNLPSFTTHHFEPICSAKKGSVKKLYPKTLRVLLQKIRDGLAHQNIEPVNGDGAFEGVIIWNLFDRGGLKQRDMKVEFSKNELKSFALFIADAYMKQSKKETTS